MSLNPAEATYFSKRSEELARLPLTLTPPTVLSDATIARDTFGDMGRAAVEIRTAQATGKLPAQWLMDSDSAQQATPLAVAHQRASFLASAGVSLVHDVTCSIGTEGAAFRDAQISYLGSDLNQARLIMARHNLGPDAWLTRADALHPTSTADVIVADPARRAGGRRITRPDDLIPPLPALIDVYRDQELAIKSAPGLDFSEWDGLVTVTSVNGGVKEACLYTPGLGTGRRAVVVREGNVDKVDSSMPDDIGAAPPGTYIIDPDGAIIRAGLVRHYGAREGLWMLDERIAYLTGDRIPTGTSGFAIVDRVPLKKLKAALTPHNVGALEILVRGLNIDPDHLRKKLKLTGTQPMALVLTRIGRNGVAFICQPRQFCG